VDIQSARTAVSARIVALAGAHDLLTDRSWAGADITDLVARAVAPFVSRQITFDGPSLDVLPNQALALSLALHELATNAVKYGALSRPEGRGRAFLEGAERPAQSELARKWRPTCRSAEPRGFGSRLIENALSRDLDGQTRLEFAPDGVRCWISAVLA
jgi:two-component sensor histidine kinase